MREALKTSISKYGPKTNAAMTVENVQGKGLQLVVIYAGRKHYLPLSSVPMNADTHANHANHQKINVNHNGGVSIAGTLTGNRLAVTTLADNGSIPITATCVNIDAGGGTRTGIRFGGTGTAGQIIIVNNTGGETLTLHSDTAVSLVRGASTSKDTMEPTGVYMFVSDGAFWNFIGGGSTPGEGLTAS